MLRMVITSTLLLLVAGVYVPGLAAKLRRRIRALLEDRGETQIALARRVRRRTGRADGGYLGKSQMSRILKYDEHASAVCIAQIEDMASFLTVPPADLLRTGEEETMSLSAQEHTLIEYFRMLPDEQKYSLIGWLEWTFKPRREANAARHQLAILQASIQRQIADLKKAR